MLIDGAEVVSQTFWSYQPPGYAYRLDSVFHARCGGLDRGDQVTIRVEPEHLTGDWRVQFYQ